VWFFSFYFLFRTILAALHFNYNLKRGSKVDDEGEPVLHVSYPKFKEGEATVKEAKVSSNYDYVADIYETITTTPRAELKVLAGELKRQVPEPVHTMLADKETKEDAVAKYKKRKEMETVICLPTCTEEELQPTGQRTRTATGRRAPHCSKCGKPKRGHKKGECA